MEVVAASPGSGAVPPFHDHDVREWSRLDSLTGVLERARLETDHWTANTGLASHKYGKVVDSRARTNADGALQQQARRQLEVFHSQVPGGQFQVIKTHTVSSSRWTSSSNNNNHTNNDTANGEVKDFENLQLSLNPLDVSSQKSKASVGRSFGRRPPSRSRLNDDTPSAFHMTNPLRNSHLTAATNLHRVSRLCNQIHETAVKHAFGKYNTRLPIHERQSGDGSVEIQEIESSISSSNDTEKNSINGHSKLTRTKSTSSEDLLSPEVEKCAKSIEDLEDLEQLQSWRRTSKIRRSLQFPKQNKTHPSKPPDLPENSGSVRKIKEDLEKGRRLSTALRGNNVDLEALDQILQSISSSNSDKNSILDDNLDEPERDQIYAKKEKRNSFVTVESIQAIKGRLRRTSSPTSDIYKMKKEEDIDDGLGSEENNYKSLEIPSNENYSPQKSRVRSYVFGMESMLNKNKSFSRTGSLESKSKQINTSTNNRNEDWYNRRKSYGFEKVQNHEETPNSISYKSKNPVESSTDSGICRSTEIVVTPSAVKSHMNGDIYNNHVENKFVNNSDENAISKVKKMTSLFDSGSTYFNRKLQNDLPNPWNKITTKDNEWDKNNIKSTTITIPIVPKNMSQASWLNGSDKEMKRHSIAVVESKYVTKNNNDNNYRRTSLAVNDKYNQMSDNNEDENNGLNRKNKKVLFCKTEVHFVADSGKVNIVETDGKPPPTNNFRRRRRNGGCMSPISDSINANGLGLLHFGDTSYEKTLLTLNNDPNRVKENSNHPDEAVYENLKPRNLFNPTVTVNTSNIAYSDYQDEIRKENLENENRKGILKNKPIKPKPYHLGELEVPFSKSIDEDDIKWGVKLKPTTREDTPVWKSTVTVHNTTYFDRQKQDRMYENITNGYKHDEKSEPEFQKMLKNLKPTGNSESLSDQDFKSMDSSGLRVMSLVNDNRRSSWSVADKVKTNEDIQWTENKGYSTKVNFGNGEAVVVENSQNNLDEKNRHPTWPRNEESYRGRISHPDHIPSRLKPRETQSPSRQSKTTEPKRTEPRHTSPSKIKQSPVASRRINSRQELKSSFNPKQLSSPSLVGSTTNVDTRIYEQPERLISSTPKTENPKRELKNRSSPIREFRSRTSPTREYKTSDDTKVQNKLVHNDVILRQPRQSEMAYFGVNVSPKATSEKEKISEAVIRKETKLSEKPDLLKHHNTSLDRKHTKQRSRTNSPAKKTSSPIYENVGVDKYKSRDFDSAILEELTKAADQILQAVNGYTDEDVYNRFSTDEEGKPHKEPLATISETKSLKQERKSKTRTASSKQQTKSKLKPTSSNSSIESIPTKECRRGVISPAQKSNVVKTNLDRTNKKKAASNDTNSATRATTKARRMQRATSREALLQSHGSSSEDMTATIEMPVRKPRLVKKTKTTQVTVTNGFDVKKKETTKVEIRNKAEKTKIGERVVNNLPEIRHKTAVSTIRSTAEKANRERSRERKTKSKNEDVKRKSPQRKDVVKGPGASTRLDRIRPVASKETMSHRSSTANIKKCPRSEASPRRN